MPLTPADVHNVAFKKPPIGKRGYDEEEVDAFLDEVERELARLVEENSQLRAGHMPAGPAGDMRHSGEFADLRTQLDRLSREKAAAEQAARSLQMEIDQMRSSGVPSVSSGDGEQQALRVLMMAQRTADEHVSDARREADKLLTSKGCVLRAVKAYHLPNCLRMSVGTEEANRLVVKTLAEMMGKTS